MQPAAASDRPDVWRLPSALAHGMCTRGKGRSDCVDAHDESERKSRARLPARIADWTSMAVEIFFYQAQLQTNSRDVQFQFPSRLCFQFAATENYKNPLSRAGATDHYGCSPGVAGVGADARRTLLCHAHDALRPQRPQPRGLVVLCAFHTVQECASSRRRARGCGDADHRTGGDTALGRLLLRCARHCGVRRWVRVGHQSARILRVDGSRLAVVRHRSALPRRWRTAATAFTVPFGALVPAGFTPSSRAAAHRHHSGALPRLPLAHQTLHPRAT